MIYNVSQLALGHALRLASLFDMLSTGTCWPHSVIQAYLVFFLPQSWIYPLLQGAYILFLGVWDLEAKIWALVCSLLLRC